MSKLPRSVALMLSLAMVIPACGGQATATGPAPGSDAGSASGGAGGLGGTGGTAGQSGSGGQAGAGGTGGSPAGGTGAASQGGSGGGAIDPTCGGVVCLDPEICCYATNQCFDPMNWPAEDCKPSIPGACTTTPLCNSDADCGADEYCVPEFGCSGPGCCQRTDMCGYMSEPVCGCDGEPKNFQAACSAGINTLNASCGKVWSDSTLIVCGNSSKWCPTGQECCPLTGTCYDPAKPLLCSVPPTGTYFPCMQDSDCPRSTDYCVGPTCGAPGGCVHQASQSGLCHPLHRASFAP